MRRLTFDPAVDGFPVWSADGATIAFETARKGNVDRPSDHAFELTKERGRRHLFYVKTTISSRGQIVLPAEFRQLDRIETGQEFDVERLDPGDYRLVRRPVAFSAGAVDWLLACPAKGYFVPVASESTDTHDLADQDRGDGTGARPDHGHPQSAGLREGRPGHR